MTLFERVARLMSDGRYWTRRQLIDALDDVKPSRLGEVLQSAVRRKAIEQTNEEPMRFRLLDAENKGGIPYSEKERPQPTGFWVLPKAQPRQWWQV